MGEGNNPQLHKEYLANKFDLPTTFAQFYLTVYRIGMGGGLGIFLTSPYIRIIPQVFAFVKREFLFFLIISVVAREIQNNGAVSLKAYI